MSKQPTVRTSKMSNLLDSVTVMTGANLPPSIMRREIMSVLRQALKIHNETESELEKCQDIIDKVILARSEMIKTGFMGCRCDRDDVSPGCCYQCLFMDIEQDIDDLRGINRNASD